jgi:anti-sigma B factor antagonist
VPDDYYSITPLPRPDLDGTAFFRLTGSLDIGARHDLREAFSRAAAEPGVTGIVVDLADVTFLDSEALAGLIEGFTEARRAGLRFAVEGARGLVHRVLVVTGTLAFFTDAQPGAASAAGSGPH